MASNDTEILISLQEICDARDALMTSGHFIRTPTLRQVQKHYGIAADIDLYLKLETLQVTGSFKIRGVFTQLTSLAQELQDRSQHLVTASAGNYGKAFAYIAKDLGLHTTVVMPHNVPADRVEIIKGYGADVLLTSIPDLKNTIEKRVKEKNGRFVPQTADRLIYAGNGSAGLEILEDVPDVDIILVCCGTSGLAAGVGAAIKQSGHQQCRIYGVEPYGARLMFESFRKHKVVAMDVHSIASGLATPMISDLSYRHCREFVDDILLVSDEEIITATLHLFGRGLKVEPSGAAAFAALLHNKVPDVAGKKVVVMVTGSNISIDELKHFPNCS